MRACGVCALCASFSGVRDSDPSAQLAPSPPRRYVGNKASNFPLQLLGIDVDPIHSCQFSNHTGHASFSGRKTTADDCRAITKGLKDNRFLDQYTHLLTGYMGSVDFLEECVTLIQEMKAQKPELVFGQSSHAHAPLPRQQVSTSLPTSLSLSLGRT